MNVMAELLSLWRWKENPMIAIFVEITYNKEDNV